MFANRIDNERYIWRGIAKAIRRVDVETLAKTTEIPLRVLEELVRFGALTDWQNEDWDPACLSWNYEEQLGIKELVNLAFALGLGLRVEMCDSESLDEWALGVASEELLPSTRVTRNPCVICRHPNRAEIEISLAAGVSTARLAKVFNIGHMTMAKHRDLCMAGRLERLEQSLGFAGDIGSLTGSVKKVDSIMELGHRIGEAALAAGQLNEADSSVKTLLQAVDIRAKLTGETGNDNESGGSGQGQPGQLQAPSQSVVFVVPGMRNMKPLDQVAGHEVVDIGEAGQ